ncbi:hypothetical protein JK358_00930 [Nocardia sp. 2]|uniref:Uncharacterized protein n=1 Tax=Nocardia acididurans TaxID=2802282 RepID=A0ABS1M1F2_9NOCA|nr:hypothetical protein [Nocardia acididurans]MBL1072953.1 hypothetical protein [Nocardia acididurans]
MPTDAWTSIQVPAGSELLWAAYSGGEEEQTLVTYWSGSETFFGEQRCLIRTDNLPAPPGPDPSAAGESRLPNAVPFISESVFLWWLKTQFGDYPANSIYGV